MEPPPPPCMANFLPYELFSRDSDLTTSIVRLCVRLQNPLIINKSSLISCSSVAHQSLISCLLISHSSVAHQSLISRCSVAHQSLISRSSVAHQSLISPSSVAHQSFRSRLLSVFRLFFLKASLRHSLFHPFVILIQRVRKAFFKRFCFVTSKRQVLVYDVILYCCW